MITKKRTAIFVDAGNFFFLQKKRLGWFVNPKEFRETLLNGDDDAGSYWHSAQSNPPRPGDEFFLKHVTGVAGYILRTKPLKEIYDESTGSIVRKGNCDVEITLNSITNLNRFDKWILVSGDGDFLELLKYMRANNKETQIVSSYSWIAKELYREAGLDFLEIETIRDQVERLDKVVKRGSHYDDC